MLALLLNSHVRAQAQPPSAEILDAAAQRYTVSTRKPYDDVLDDLEFAISQKNYRITGRNQIGKAITDSENIAYPKSTIIHFCSIQAAREIYDRNPDFLLYMPCRITLREDHGSTIVEARLVPENDPGLTDISLRINAMLRSIVDYAVE